MDSLISGICQFVFDKLQEEGGLLLGVPEEAQKMEKTLKRIQEVLTAAEKKEIEEARVKSWLLELKEVAYDIEDVLDDWSIAQLQGNNNPKKEVCFYCIPTPSLCFKQAKGRHDIAHDIVAINANLDGIDDRKNKFNLPKSDKRINEGAKSDQDTTSFKKFTFVHSQDQHKEQLIEKLVYGDFKSTDSGEIPMISVVGMGGIGKTTLARMVWINAGVREHFSKIIWVCVSNTFVKINVAKAIAKGFDLDVGVDSTTQDVLSKVEGYLRRSTCKFLLVLDDVWEDSEGGWDDILGCIGQGNTKGSRILMTTRSLDFSRKMRAVFALPVDVLSETDARSLFNYYAFRGDPDHRGIVEDVAEELVKKCDGLPLALEVLGRHMVSKTLIGEWNDVLSSKMWEKDFQDNVFRSLSFSYLELRSEAKRCFAFCSIYPKDTVMKKKELIRLWIAQGYLQGRKADHMEILGEECFKSLVSRSFFRVTESEIDGGGDIEVTMHDVVHDFAQYISNGEAAILDSSLEMHTGGDIAKPRHLTFTEKISESNPSYLAIDFQALRTLFFPQHSPLVLKNACSKKSYIRALDIQFPRSEHLVDCLEGIRKLIHLRYLCLSSYNLYELPEEISSLRYLQTLDLRGCKNLKKLSKEIVGLTSLRHLLFARDGEIISLPKGFGKLTSLRTLSCFFCSSLNNNEDCSSLQDLRGLNNLRGDLLLKNLHKVADADEVIRAELRKKTQIRRLKLEFKDGDASLQLKVLEALKPAQGNLEFLKITGHRGRRCPQWIGKMQHLKEVKLKVVSMQFLPQLGMLRFLEKLSVEKAEEVKYVGEEFHGVAEKDKVLFPKLTDLIFYGMYKWERWEDPKEITGMRAIIMPSLRHLRATLCGELLNLPCFLQYAPLEMLEVDSPHLPPPERTEDDNNTARWRMGDILLPQTLKNIETAWIELREVEATSEMVQQQDVNLYSLKIGRSRGVSSYSVPGWIMDLTYVKDIHLSSTEDALLPPLGLMPYLEELIISNLDEVEKVGDEFLGMPNNNNDGDNSGGGTGTDFIAFPRLKRLTFMCMSVRRWEDPVHRNGLIVMPSLCHLEIIDCKELESLPQFFEAVPLQKLYVLVFHPLPPRSGTKNPRVTRSNGKNRLMLKIRNCTEDEPSYKMIKERNTTTLAQPDFHTIRLHGVKNEWLLDWEKYCVGLKELELHNCGETSFVRLKALPYLEKLVVEHCDFCRIGMEMIWISNLKELCLHSMDNLVDWEGPPQLEESSNETRERQHGGNSNSAIINFMPNLRILDLDSCPQLKALPSFLRSIPLKLLMIAHCHALDTWWENEAGQDWHNWKSNIPHVSITVGGKFTVSP